MATRQERMRGRLEAEAALARGKLREAARAYGTAWTVLRAMDGHTPQPEDVRVAVMEATGPESPK